jgi:hypothetical protein
LYQTNFPKLAAGKDYNEWFSYGADSRLFLTSGIFENYSWAIYVNSSNVWSPIKTRFILFDV